VLILGASGNVGRYAVQLAQSAGARVLTAADGEKVDVVIDTVGGDVQRASFDSLRSGGRLISSVSPPDAELAIPLAQARVAHEMLAGAVSHSPGKIVLELRP
jgi:NADPH:quinone reductase-like Zn-dependent oxidoreductase